MSVISCPSCSRSLTKDALPAGKRIRCGRCKHVFTVPANDLQELDDLEEIDDPRKDAVQPAKKRPLGRVVPPPLPDQGVDPEEVDDPRKDAVQPAKKRPLGRVVPPPLPDQGVDPEEDAIQPAKTRPLGRVVPPPLPDQGVDPPTDAPESDEDYSLPPYLRRRGRRDDDRDDDDEDDRPKKKAKDKPKRTKSIKNWEPLCRHEKSSWLPSISVSRGILTGLLMMVGAVIWFVVGLAAGWVYFYPPVMFVLGLVAVIRGLLGHEE